ncbi:putative uncharacterized protein DDB_G0286901 isoform X2 [Ctenocephalides felis]|uniref:putative uncharacterized protein DDB_G0286901 isoform X2 n=1 Tax=Ctenocephalides felis TaxID=7515 RepID=UPI000E6E5449|nr:putative uncharacterized protein DDB_G0286901 isoform X2 [Ctenocephalides felis]
MSMLNMVGDDVKECPLCLEVLEVDDVTFYPCTCLYQICRFCWHRLRTDGNGLCPACRKAYPENPADFTPLSQQQIAALKAKKRHQDQQRKQKIYENRKHLANVRVLQKNLVFVVGLPMRLADSEILKKHEYFGKFGKILKVVINQSTSYAGPQGPSASAYVTYSHNNDALRAIQSVNNITMDGRLIKTSLGTTKYCSHFMKNLPCPKQDCMYLHELDPDASFTKEEMHLGKHQEYEKKLHDTLIQQTANKSDRTPSVTTSNGLGTSTSNTYKNNSPTQLASDNGSTVPPLISSQSKEAWPSLNTISPSGNNIYNNAKDKKSQSTGKENINSKSDKLQKGEKQSKQSKSSKDTKVGKSKLKCSETNGQVKSVSSKSPDKDSCNSLQSGSSGESTPEPCNHINNDINSPNDDPLQKSDSSTENELHFKTNSEDLSLNNGNSNYPIKPFVLNDATADLSRLSIFDDNNSFFSTPSYKKYLNTERPLSSSVDSHSLSPDSLCGRSPFEMAGDTNGVDAEKSVVKEIHNNSSATSDNIEYAPTLTNINSNPPRQMSMLNDFLPLINSSEDWQAAFGFPNTASNQIEQRLYHSESPRGLGHLTNGVTHANLQDFQGLHQNGDYLNGSSDVQSDVEEHHLLDNKLYEPHRVSNSVSQFLTDYYKGNSKYLEKFLESTNPEVQQPLFMNNGCGESPNQNSNQLDSHHPREYIEYYNSMLNAQRPPVNLAESKFSDLHSHINAQNHVNQQNISSFNSTNSNVQYSNHLPSFRSNNHCHTSSDDDLGFDPFQETQKAFALMESEMVLQQNSNRGHNKYGENLSQRTRLPPPGFSHMNAFGIGVPRAQQAGNKALPHLNVNNTPSANWGSMSYQQQMQNSSAPLPLSQHQQHIKGMNMVPDWTTLDPAIMSTSRNFGHSLIDKHDANDGLFLGQKSLYTNSNVSQQQNQTQQLTHALNSMNSIHAPHPSNGQFGHFGNNQIHNHNALMGTPQHSNMNSNIINTDSYNIGHHNVNMSMPMSLQNQWHNSEQSFYANSTLNSDIHKYQISMPPGFQNSTSGGNKANKTECIESN